MTEKSFPGPMSMIKIDGHKIKVLREQQGLTQLYLATAVDVTTDTISRWENKRYPSIKKENGIRLAEALEVELEEILDTQDEPAKSETVKPAEHHAAQTPDTSKEKKTLLKSWPILLLSGTLFGVIIAFIYSFFQMSSNVTVTATRIAPSHYIVGQVFPVKIELLAESDDEVAFILKESIPANAEIIKTQPQHSGHNEKSGKSGKSSQTSFLKWITKAKIPTSFSYLMKYNGREQPILTFEGSIATAGGDALPIAGNSTMRSGNHHWADTDRDNTISDEEILTVYDKFSGIIGLEDEIDLIEEIWLGDGYNWNTDTLDYDITE
ncbi:helix-turn-helix transcriptional regulator [Desulforhopalus sp. 52FAK]